jgi:hypothetical protein
MLFTKNTVFNSMKKGRILTVINEKVEKTYLSNMNEDSYYEGHKFVDYGKNIENVSLIMPSTDMGDYSINKDKLMITWGVKFEFRNSGIEGVQVNVLGIEANLMITGGDAEPQETPINFAEYEINVIKEKDLENKEFQMFITSIEVDAEQRVVNVVVSI